MEIKSTIKGYIIEQKQRSENGSLILVLHSKGLSYVNSSKGNLITGKNVPLGSLNGAFLELDLAQKNESAPYMLRAINIIKNYCDYSKDLISSIYLMCLNEYVLKLFKDDDEALPYIFSIYNICIEKYLINKNALSCFTLFVAKTFEFLGLEPEVDECVICGQTSNLISFSMYEGGLVCKSCAEESNIHSLLRLSLLTYRYLFNTPIEESTPEKIETNTLLKVCDSFIEFLKDEYNTNIDSYKMMREIINK